MRVRISLLGARTHRSLKRLLTSTPATGTVWFILRSPFLRVFHRLQELTGAYETRVGGRAAPIQPKGQYSRRMNGRSRFRVIPEETQQAGVPLSSRFGFILIQLSSGRNPTTHPGKPNQLTAFQCTGKQGIVGPTMRNWTSRRGREVQSACWWQRPQTPLNSSILELAARPWRDA